MVQKKKFGHKNLGKKKFVQQFLAQEIFGSKGILSKRNCAQRHVQPLSVNLGNVKFFSCLVQYWVQYWSQSWVKYLVQYAVIYWVKY